MQGCVADSALSPLLRLVTSSVVADISRGEVATSPRGVPLAVARAALDDGPWFVLVATHREADELEEDLAAWLGDENDVVTWPAWDVAPFERVSPDTVTMGRRAQIRHRLANGDAPRVIIATARSALQVIPPRGDARQLVAGEEVDRDELLRWLIANGYRREPQVEHRGDVAVRGDIVDVWLSHLNEPIRVELFGDEIERITVFDVTTQRSVESLERCDVFPAREWQPSDDVRATAQRAVATHPALAEVLQPLCDGEFVDGMESWLGWLCPHASTLINVLEESRKLLVVDPERVRQRSEDILLEESELADVMAATWGLMEAPLLHRTMHDTFGDRQPDVVVRSDIRGSVSWPVTDPPVCQGDVHRLATHVHADDVERAILVVGSLATQSRLISLLEDTGLAVADTYEDDHHADLCVIVAPLARGLSTPTAVVWSEADFTGRRIPRRQPRARSRHVDGFFDDLAVGALVVHRTIGIARYAGAATRTIGETTRDYLILEFRGTDRLFLPTDQIDLVTPYTGGGTPQLSRMGGTEWQRTTARARADAQLIADELVTLYRLRAAAPGHAFAPDSQWQREMENLFPFTETFDQRRAIEDVKSDMESSRPMDRLVCADVGFGKTEIAIRAIFKAVQDNKQAALLVPTTLLASQHYTNIVERFASFPVRVALLSRFVSDDDAAATLKGLREGSIDVVVGTHRLLGDKVAFKDLGLLVVDEEQRFGVSHKDAIKRLSVGVDVLTLTASPIPRTLEMALTGIRDLSMVTTPPVDRQPILTHVGEFDDGAVIEAIRRELLRDGQVFYVHNKVADIDEVATQLGRLVPEARIAVAHAQMEEDVLERTVQDFFEHRFDVLVCTTIVESGIDMPSVNTLIVDRADRLGLGQLHQLRGRVGRSGVRAYAYLFHPRGVVLSETAFERLRCIGDNTALGSGFKIAMRDLEIRGAGSLLGHRQSGHVAAVGYDLYVQLVAEAVAEAKGVQLPSSRAVVLPRLGHAFLPESYIRAEDQRLEAYRRLTTSHSVEELQDVADEWRDRYGVLPPEAEELLRVMELRVACVEYGIDEVTTGVRHGTTFATVRASGLSPEFLLALQQRESVRSVDTATHVVTLAFDGVIDTVVPVTALVHELWSQRPSVA